MHGSWQRPPAELVVESAGAHGNDVHDACATFVGWLFTQSPVPGSFAVLGVPGVPFEGEPFDPWAWYDRVMAEVARWKPQPVLVDLDDLLVTQGGEILWPPPERRREPRVDRRVQPLGAPFPVGWYGQRLGELRPGRGTYNCYPPDELPPVRVPLAGTFDWLMTAPERDRSLAADPAAAAAALERLLASAPAGLPPAFITFFRSPVLWRRVQSPTDCYLHLDSAAVDIPGGLGTLTRFLSDSQGCRHWHLHTSPCGMRYTVVTTYRFTGSDSAEYGALPHVRDTTTVSDSFEEFVYRFWIEGELWHALHGSGNMPPGGDEYLAFYRAGAQASSHSPAAGASD